MLVIWIDPVDELKLVGLVIEVSSVPDESNSLYESTQLAGYNYSFANDDALITDIGVARV